MNDCVGHGTPSASCTVRSAELWLREIIRLIGSRAYHVKLFLKECDYDSNYANDFAMHDMRVTYILLGL